MHPFTAVKKSLRQPAVDNEDGATISDEHVNAPRLPPRRIFIALGMLMLCVVGTAFLYKGGVKRTPTGICKAFRFQVHETGASVWPPIEDVVDFELQSAKPGANLQFLADFAIVAHPKTATTALADWLREHEEIQMPEVELHALTGNHVADFAQWMYDLRCDRLYKYGWKAPNDLNNPISRNLIRTHLPDTKLIVGIRHPIKWFESYYNYKTRRGRTLPPAETLVGSRLPDKGLYQVHLAMMGKTNLSNPMEASLVRPYVPEKDWNTSIPHMSNPVFVYEVSQPFESDPTRKQEFRDTLGNFLGLSTPLNHEIESRDEPSPNYHFAIDICDEKFDQLRQELVDLGSAAGTWILDYFLDLPEVTYSSPGRLKELIRTWAVDPCANSNIATTTMEPTVVIVGEEDLTGN
jgi:hypothetical protein